MQTSCKSGLDLWAGGRKLHCRCQRERIRARPDVCAAAKTGVAARFYRSKSFHYRVSSALRRQNYTEQNALIRPSLARSADVSATIGRDDIVDFVIRNARPFAIHFDFIVVCNRAALGWTTIRQAATRTMA